MVVLSFQGCVIVLGSLLTSRKGKHQPLCNLISQRLARSLGAVFQVRLSNNVRRSVHLTGPDIRL